MQYVERTVEKTIKKTSATFPAVLITGPRQVGKTTVLKKCAEAEFAQGINRAYVSLDTMANRQLAKNDPALFLERYPAPLLIDEIQYAPELLPYIKSEIDSQNKEGLYWLTGSQQFHLMQGVSESLAGRLGIINLYGFSLSEMSLRPDSPPFFPDLAFFSQKALSASPKSLLELYSLIWHGSYPRLVTNENVDWEQFYSSYTTTYIERDIRFLTNVSSELSFMNFIRICAARTGQLLNYSDLAKETGISLPTAKGWLSLLLSSGLIYLLHPYSSNIEKRVIKTPKLYFMDTGLAAFLTGWQTAKTLEIGSMNGAFLETFVIAEIVKSYAHAGKTPHLYFYRDHDQKEIDLLMEQNSVLHPFEIKKKSTPDADDIRHFSVLKKLNKPIGHGGVICLGGTHLPITQNASAIPVWYL